MVTTISSKGQIVLPAAARHTLRLTQGDRLAVELREGGVFLRSATNTRAYRVGVHPVSGLPVMMAQKRGGRKVTAEEIARLHAELG